MAGLRSFGSGQFIVLSVLLLLPLLVQGLKPRAKGIPDDLRDVEDDEEDEEWKEWGRSKKAPVINEQEGFELNNGPIDVTKLQNKQKSGPQLCFARLRPDPKRTEADVKELGDMWSMLLKTGGMSDQIYPIDDSTILISITDGKYMEEIKDFVLSRAEAYEFEWKQQKWRRPGDPELTKKEEPKKPQAKKPKKNKKSKKKSKSNKDTAEL